MSHVPTFNLSRPLNRLVGIDRQTDGRLRGRQRAAFYYREVCLIGVSSHELVGNGQITADSHSALRLIKGTDRGSRLSIENQGTMLTDRHGTEILCGVVERCRAAESYLKSILFNARDGKLSAVSKGKGTGQRKEIIRRRGLAINLRVVAGNDESRTLTRGFNIRQLSPCTGCRSIRSSILQSCRKRCAVRKGQFIRQSCHAFIDEVGAAHVNHVCIEVFSNHLIIELLLVGEVTLDIQLTGGSQRAGVHGFASDICSAAQCQSTVVRHGTKNCTGIRSGCSDRAICSNSQRISLQ